MHGFELLLLHGIPVSQCVSRAMGCSVIKVCDLSHRVQSKLAGNSMHSCCIGLMFLAVLCFAAG